MARTKLVKAKVAKPVRRKVSKPAPKFVKDTASLTLVKDGLKLAASSKVQGGIEFEFASDIDHHEFAKVLIKTLGLSKEAVKVFPVYNPSANDRKDYTKWNVESDSSIPTTKKHTHKIELVTPAMPILNLIHCIEPIFGLIQKHGATSDNTGLHMTLSTPHKMATELDTVKLMTLLSEAYVGEEYGRDDQHRYAKMVIPSLLEKVRTQNQFGTLRETIEHFVNNPKRIADKTFPLDKMNSMNFSKAIAKNLVEFRLPGGNGYEKKTKLTRGVISRFAGALAASVDRRAFFKEYIKTLIRLYEDARPSQKDPLLQGIRGRPVVKWLVKAVEGGKQFSLVDVSDGPVQKTKEWADLHLVCKLVARDNNGALELVGSGEGSGWNPNLVENATRSEDRRLVRIRDHMLRNKHPYNRKLVNKIKRDGSKVNTGFFANRGVSDYIQYVVAKIASPASSLGLPANHMARQYLGIHITPELAKTLLKNPAMVPYVSWYFTDMVLKGRLAKIPSEVLHYALLQKEIPSLELAELAMSYIKSGYIIPLEIFVRACKDKHAEQFTRALYAAAKHYKLETQSTQAVQYAVTLTKNPSKQVDLLKDYSKSYANKAGGTAAPKFVETTNVVDKAKKAVAPTKTKVEKPGKAPKPKPVSIRTR